MPNNSLYPAKRRRNESKLQAHLEALIDMHQKGYSMVMMQEYLASLGIEINATTIWRYLQKQIARRPSQSNLNTNIKTTLATVNRLESIGTPNYQQNSTDKSLQKSTLEKLNDMSNAENEF
jgi:hypothetical protein